MAKVPFGDDVNIANTFIKEYNESVNIANTMVNAGRNGATYEQATDELTKSSRYVVSQDMISGTFLHAMYDYGVNRESNNPDKTVTYEELRGMYESVTGGDYSLTEADDGYMLIDVDDEKIETFDTLKEAQAYLWDECLAPRPAMGSQVIKYYYLETIGINILEKHMDMRMPFDEGGGYNAHFRTSYGESYIQYNPSSSHHEGMPYYKVSSGNVFEYTGVRTGTQRFFVNGQIVRGE